MKKLLSVLLSALLCATITVTNPPVPIVEGVSNPSQIEQYEDENVASPCDNTEYPGLSGDGAA